MDKVVKGIINRVAAQANLDRASKMAIPASSTSLDVDRGEVKVKEVEKIEQGDNAEVPSIYNGGSCSQNGTTSDMCEDRE